MNYIESVGNYDHTIALWNLCVRDLVTQPEDKAHFPTGARRKFCFTFPVHATGFEIEGGEKRNKTLVKPVLNLTTEIKNFVSVSSTIKRM